MTTKQLDECDKKAVEVIAVVNGLSSAEINYIFTLVEYSVSNSSTSIEFQIKGTFSSNADTLNGGRNC